MMNLNSGINLWAKIRRRHLLLFIFSAFLSAFGLFDLIYFFYGFQPIIFWANDFLLIGSAVALFVVVLVSVDYAPGEYDPEWIRFQSTSRKMTDYFVKPRGIGKIAQSLLGKSIQPLWQSAMNIIQLVSLMGIASYYLGIQYGKSEDIKETIVIVASAAILVVGIVILENLLVSKDVLSTGNVDNKADRPRNLHFLRSKPLDLSDGGVSGISRGEYISLLDKVILSDEFRNGQDD